ncbi:MAG: tyrosine-type recombinase/integrase [Clostridia bacterium]|nr:tyrosine-type recombinase/integrase [Clostridia bacterium]
MNLENRGNGSWRVQISDGYNPDGTKRLFRRTIKVDPNKTETAQRREAAKQAALIEADYRRKLLLMGSKTTIAQLAQEYLLDRVERKGLKESTVKQYRDIILGRIVPELGKKYVQDLTARDINAFYRKLKDAPALTKRSKTGKLSGTTRRQYHTQLHAMLSYAVKTGYIAVNPADQVEPPQKDTGETQWYELDQAGQLLRALDTLEETQWQLFFNMAIYTGMRPGELVALNWSDIKGNVLYVKASAVFVKGQGTKRQESPKTEKGWRKIILPGHIVDLLAIHRKEQLTYRLPFGKNWSEPDAVFTTDDGRRTNISTPTHIFQKILRKHNLPPLTLYGLRHTSATTMIAQGVSVRDVAERLGHAQTSTTMNIYAHALKDASEKATEAVASALDAAKRSV